MAQTILIIEDERRIAAAVSDYLKAEGFAVVTAEDGVSGLERARALRPDLVVLDLMLPLMSGLEVLRELRRESSLPVIVLTARSEETDRVLGLELGADDYLTKPFSLRELTARVRAVLRRAGGQGEPEAVISAGGVTLDLERHEASVNGMTIDLTPTEFRLLARLIERPGRVHSRLQLLEAVYGDVYEGYERSIDTHISNLRRKIERAGLTPAPIETVFGIGYRYRAEKGWPGGGTSRDQSERGGDPT